MKNLLNSLSNAVKNFFTFEVKGFAGESAEANDSEYFHLDSGTEYDQVGGGSQNDDNNTKPPKGMILMPFLMDGEGFEPGDTTPDTMVSISITKAGISETLNFSVIDADYNELFAQASAEGTIVEQNDPNEGQFFTLANPQGQGFISYVDCDSTFECIQVNHNIQDSFRQTGCMLLINKSMVSKEPVSGA